MHPRTTTRRTFAQTLARAVLTPVLVVGGAAAGYAGGAAAVAAGLLPGAGILDSQVQDGPDAGSPDTLFAAHDCWTGEADLPPDLRGRRPGHVIVTPAPTRRTPHPRPTYSAGLVDEALDHVFGTDRHPGMTVHAFCR
ncbi:hypothetical protein FB382_000948 [Nocardioides ginsengisegetis]|uniref:Uncharacterized protein n=1 Tax=Nocardioides ginsengisegetis TaxID=661491 RepID=A0A7W3IXU2_9ACTN|nr:hypothetical protein [Nocardioides ginsengisegetis]MBA8802657.1 hypothetical protein [Nocardioides ginsengisegetis]